MARLCSVLMAVETTSNQSHVILRKTLLSSIHHSWSLFTSAADSQPRIDRFQDAENRYLLFACTHFTNYRPTARHLQCSHTVYGGVCRIAEWFAQVTVRSSNTVCCLSFVHNARFRVFQARVKNRSSRLSSHSFHAALFHIILLAIYNK